jgi:hypothetical protein
VVSLDANRMADELTLPFRDARPIPLPRSEPVYQGLHVRRKYGSLIDI